MGDTGTATERDTVLAQIERLNRSAILHGSESLCKLLRYLAEHSLDTPGAPLKEYQIATEVFGRPADFDPRLDSTVRVQTGRLRSKLSEYYAGDGAHDPIAIEIPKGAYTLIYHLRPPIEEPPHAVTAEAPPPVRPARPYPISWFFLSIIIGAVVVVVIAFAATRFLAPIVPAGVAPDPPAPVLESFWNVILSGPDPPLVVYSNAEFVGRPETGLRYFNPATDSGKPILDHYTGVGEVIAVHELDRVFTSLRRPVRIKRGRLLTGDDAKASDLIFIGSPSENLWLRELPGTRDFVFSRQTEGPRTGDLMIANQHPDQGEQTGYLASESPIIEDYALVTLTPGLASNHRVLMLAGITTFGTQAAVEFVCRPARLEELLARLGASGHELPPFEALLRVKVSGGVPVQGELAAVHVHRN